MKSLLDGLKIWRQRPQLGPLLPVLRGEGLRPSRLPPALTRRLAEEGYNASAPLLRSESQLG